MLHAANSPLVLALGRRAFHLPWPAATVAGVSFAVAAVHVETVVWISGRADSIPALLMLLTLLAYTEWRAGGRWTWYALAVGSCGLALFSKQSAVVLPVALALFDVVVRGAAPWPARRLAPLLPFVLLTAAYLALRLALFGNAVREDSLNTGLVLSFFARQPVYLTMLLTGAERWLLSLDNLLLAGGFLALLAAATTVRRHSLGPGGAAVRWILFWGPVWWLLTVGPLAVVGYLSSRHLYLASAGPVLLLAAAGATALSSPLRRARWLAGLGGVALVSGSLLAMRWQSAEWAAAARLSQQVTHDVAEQLAHQPAGRLTIVAAPPAGPNLALWTWLWAFATPFALDPPFAPDAQAGGARYLTLPENTCCPSRWYAGTRRTLDGWAASGGREVEVLGWTTDGRLLRAGTALGHDLTDAVTAMRQADDAVALNRALQGAVRTLGSDQAPYRHR